MTRTEFFIDAERFAAVAQPLIDRDPIGSTLFLHVLANHLASPFPGPLLMAAVTDGGRIGAAAMRVPGFAMIGVLDPSTADPATVLGRLADDVLARGEPIVGFTGRRRTAKLLTDAWSERTGATSKPHMWTLLYRLGELTPPVGVPGTPRLAAMDDPADVALLADWFCEFRRETGVGSAPNVPDPQALVRNAERGEVFTLWCVDGRTVAVAGHSAVRRGGAKIAPVYTPPEHRRRGFGSAVTVAAIESARRLGAGEIMLFTDADYPASNAVYRGLGFEVIAEFAEFEVVDAVI
jgi:ribosomal protein S18 acetylase RimI-like enzyme